MKRLKYGGLLCSVFILWSLVLYVVGSAGNAHAAWNVSTIATPTGTTYYDTKGQYSSIGIDSNNKAHISYMYQYSVGSGSYSWNLTILLIPPVHGRKHLLPLVAVLKIPATLLHWRWAETIRSISAKCMKHLNIILFLVPFKGAFI
jgi:hypothetical protein